RDNGCGIPEDRLTKIFNPFYTTKQNGTGLGMGIAKKVMDAHRGRIEVQSQIGEWTEFLLSIPLSDAARLWTKPASPDSGEEQSLAEQLQTSSTSAPTVSEPVQVASRGRQ